MKHLLKTHGYGLASQASFSLAFIFSIPIFLWCLVLAAFPVLENCLLIALLPVAVSVISMLLVAFLNCYRVTLTETAVVLTWLGIPFRKLPVEKLQLFCAAGDSDFALCLTTRSLDELATREERLLLRNPLTKCDIPFLKQNPNWRTVFAGKYLDRIRKSPLGIFRDRQVAYLFMDPVVQFQVRALYPQLAYKNLTNIKLYSQDPCEDKTVIPHFSLSSPYFVELQEDAVLLRNQKEVKRSFSFAAVKTVVRADIFWYDRRKQHYTRVLVLSVFTPDALAAKVTEPANNPLLRAYRCAEKAAGNWTIKQKDFCNLPCTAEMADHLRTHCPEAQWIDLTDNWLL